METDRTLHLYEITHMTGEKETLQAHSLAFMGGNMAASFARITDPNAPVESRRLNFYRHPAGVILSILEDDIRCVRMLEVDPVESGKTRP